MGLFDFLFKRRKQDSDHSKQIHSEKVILESKAPIRTDKAISESKPSFRKGIVSAQKVDLNNFSAKQLHEKFIAFDVETTGLNPVQDRIIEIGAVIFCDGKPTKSFSTLINPGIKIPASASAVNHITNDMIFSAPDEVTAYKQFIEFLGGALTGDIMMCAHNARFDFNFLTNTLSRLGYDGDFKYIDTLSLARKRISGVENYKQSTLEAYFGLNNTEAHRAYSDAENCGQILVAIMDRMAFTGASPKQEPECITSKKLSENELRVCAYIQNIIVESGGDPAYLRFRKSSADYVCVACLYPFIKFKFSKRGPYIILRKESASRTALPSEPCIASEGGATFSRIYFSNISDLQPLVSDIFALYKHNYQDLVSYLSEAPNSQEIVQGWMQQMISLSPADIIHLLSPGRSLVDPSSNRIPLSAITAISGADFELKTAFTLYDQGETARKEGNIQEALSLFENSRLHGYHAPALYESYALAYRKIKDYEHEIQIIEEAIAHNPESAEVMERRKSRALELLIARQETQQRSIKSKQQAVSKNNSQKKPRGRAIIQTTDDGVIIKEFETVAAAVRETGINSKSIRDAANGVQKHAGGYRWIYKDCSSSQ